MVARRLHTAWFRLLSDLDPRDRGREYARLLSAARDLGYRMLSLAEFWAELVPGPVPAETPILVLRHDVDLPDPAGNRLFYRIERQHEAHASYYFRLATVVHHTQLVNDLRRDGFETGYHFEEAATVAKRAGLRSRDELLARRDEIVDSFQANVAEFRRRWNPGLTSVASHGDWINRRLSTSNGEFLDEEGLRAAGLSFEAYDQRLMSAVDVYISDVAPPPARWKGNFGLGDALRERRSPTYVLTHERQWHGAPLVKGLGTAGRLGDEIIYRLRTPAHPRRGGPGRNASAED